MHRIRRLCTKALPGIKHGIPKKYHKEFLDFACIYGIEYLFKKCVSRENINMIFNKSDATPLTRVCEANIGNAIPLIRHSIQLNADITHRSGFPGDRKLNSIEWTSRNRHYDHTIEIIKGVYERGVTSDEQECIDRVVTEDQELRKFMYRCLCRN